MVIIDTGSFKNDVSLEMVQNLKLKTVSNPYQLCWLQKGNEIKVSKRCLVSFSIVKSYKHDVWCDVALMDACHLLLGRPWHYFDTNTLNRLKTANTLMQRLVVSKLNLM